MYTLIFLGSFLADTDYTDAFWSTLLLTCETIVLNFIRYKKFNSTQDANWENESRLREQNDYLKSSQETEVALQIAEERNRIARDIHDNVGHLLSSAILQLGAIQAINQNKQLHLPLDQLNRTMNLGMDRIRESVHDLHHHSLPFPQALDLLLSDFQFCTVEGNRNTAKYSLSNTTNCPNHDHKRSLDQRHEAQSSNKK